MSMVGGCGAGGVSLGGGEFYGLAFSSFLGPVLLVPQVGPFGH